MSDYLLNLDEHSILMRCGSCGKTRRVGCHPPILYKCGRCGKFSAYDELEWKIPKIGWAKIGCEKKTDGSFSVFRQVELSPLRV